MAVVSENGDFCRYTDSSEKGHNIWFHRLLNVQMALENAVSTNIILSFLGLALFKFVESLPLRDFKIFFQAYYISFPKLSALYWDTYSSNGSKWAFKHRLLPCTHRKTIEEQPVCLGSHVSEESKCGSFLFFFFLQNICHMASCKVICHHRAEHKI